MQAPIENVPKTTGTQAAAMVTDDIAPAMQNGETTVAWLSRA